MPDDTGPILREALEHLAADAEAQAAYLRKLGTWPSLDQLALEFDDVAEASGSPTFPTMLRSCTVSGRSPLTEARSRWQDS